MRYPSEHKAIVHQQIVKDAARQVRAAGINGAAVSAIMQDSGLTHGGFYKHFASKDDLILESLGEAFTETFDWLVQVGKQAKPGTAWKAIVKAYLSLDHCSRTASGCPLAALGPELARAHPGMKGQLFAELVRYKSKMQPLMPGRRSVDKEAAFFAIFSTMAGAIEIARMLPQPAMREKVLKSARDLLLRSYRSPAPPSKRVRSQHHP